jgi:cytidylate kinase
MAVITISKEYAADTEIFVQKLGEELGYSVLDKALVARVASRGEIPESEAPGPRPGPTVRLLRLIDEYTAKTVKKVVDHTYGRLDDRSYYESTSRLVLKAAEDGNVIVVGWGGQCILGGRPEVFHVRIVKNIEERMKWLHDHLGLDSRSARALIEREEKESSAYVETCFNRAWDDPHLYHLILNLSKLPIHTAVEQVVHLVRRLEKPSGDR